MILSELMSYLFVFVVGFAFLFFIQEYLKSRKLPTGPWGLPVLGYLPFIGNKPFVNVTELAKTYGNVFSLKLGSKYVVFLNDWKAVKEAFSKDDFLGRPDNILGQGVFKSKQNIVTGSGTFWTEQRRFAFKLLRNLGFGSQVMESNIKDEISHLLKEIDESPQPIDVHELLTPSVSNVISLMVFGHRYDYHDPLRKKMDYLLTTIPRLLQVTSIATFFPFVYKLYKIFGNKNTKQLLKNMDEYEQIVKDEIKEHEKNWDESKENADNYIDGYLVEMKKRKAKNEMGTFSADALISNARSFFSAGSETVRTTLNWTFKWLSVRPEIQERLHEEIDSVVGRDRMVSWTDRQFMTYTVAVINEVQRWASVLPFNIPRRAMKDTEVLGHFIPKNTTVIANFWAINHDENLYKNPYEFNPNRFLVDNGKRVLKDESLIPYSYGKRICVGEILADFEIFLYLVSILQKYKIELPEGEEVSFESTLTITLRPQQVPVLNFLKR